MTTEVKICGIKTEAALNAALENGADYVGLVFFAKSPRNIDLGTAGKLARLAHEKSRTKVVTLLVDPDDALVDSIVAEVRPDILQLHGHESVERVEDLVARTGKAIWKAVPVASSEDVTVAQEFSRRGKANLILFDAKPLPGTSMLPGGNGLTFDWRILASQKDKSFALAGGLTPENVADAIRLVNPAVVDVSSGVETRPGEKSAELIRRFLRAAKGVKG